MCSGFIKKRLMMALCAGFGESQHERIALSGENLIGGLGGDLNNAELGDNSTTFSDSLVI